MPEASRFSAQIELRPNGDFMLRSNCVETVCRRINPDDWDDDGLPNDVDPNPMTWDGDFTGPDNILPNDANTNAYYTISIRVAGPDSLVSFVGDGPSNYPDPQFVARGGELYDVVLLMGKKYGISCERPVSVVSASDPATQVWNDCNGERNIQMVRRPVTATATSLAGFGSPESKRQFRMSVEPNNLNGVFSWTNSCGAISVFGSDIFMYAPCLGCTCGGCCAYGNYSYEGYSLEATGGMCPCEFLDDNPQIESSISPQPAVSAAFSHSAVIYEDRYENLPNQWVEKRSTHTRLDIQANGGLRGGTLSVAVQNLDKLARFSGANPPTAAVAVAAGDMVTYSAIYEAATHSAEPNDISVVATFAENETGETLAATSKVTTVKVELTVVNLAPANSSPHRHVFGVLEEFRYAHMPAATVTEWRFFEGLLEKYPFSTGKMFLPATTNQTSNGNCRFRVSVGNAVYENAYAFFLPQISVRNARCNENISPVLGEAGWLVLHYDQYVEPFYVSFEGLEMVEIADESGNCPHSGYYDDVARGGPLSHCRAVGAGNFIEVDNRGQWGSDKCGRSGSYAPPLSAGWKEWPIPVGWGVQNDLLASYDRPPTNQRFTLHADGTFAISKYTYKATRATNESTGRIEESQ